MSRSIEYFHNLDFLVLNNFAVAIINQENCFLFQIWFCGDNFSLGCCRTMGTAAASTDLSHKLIIT